MNWDRAQIVVGATTLTVYLMSPDDIALANSISSQGMNMVQERSSYGQAN
jgi:hypothetical protein